MTKQIDTNNDLKKLTKKLSKVVIAEPEPEEFAPLPETIDAPADGFYIHLDIHSHSKLIKRDINTYMVSHDAFDPRIAVNHPSDLLADTKTPDTLRNRRLALGMSPDRYEFWKVKGDFSLHEFNNYVRSLTNCNTYVKVLVVIDNEHDKYRFFTNNQN